jgi:hypothetical protein
MSSVIGLPKWATVASKAKGDGGAFPLFYSYNMYHASWRRKNLCFGTLRDSMFCNNLLRFYGFLSICFDVLRRQGPAPRIPQPPLGHPDRLDETKG